MMLHLMRSMIVSQRSIVNRISVLQYTRNDQAPSAAPSGRAVESSLFSRRVRQVAQRVEQFNDKVKRLSLFDLLTGHVVQEVPCLHHLSENLLRHFARAFGASDERHQSGTGRTAPETAGQWQTVGRAAHVTAFAFDLEMMNELGYFSGIENYSRYLASRWRGEPPPTLFNYLPADRLLVVDESHDTIPQIGGMYRGDWARKETLAECGFSLPTALDNRPIKFEEFAALVPLIIYVSATPGPYELEMCSNDVIDQLERPIGLLDP